ncbi:hypothetical protein [Acidiferrobacter sp. SPIII_3]|uniref:hypothetical protein n=1 Tax=Acidiferrobacter sp. SPIII_3 TaxID=1281578 RepID=UPI00143D8B00|nr:hypothetical protein [Acidiferrobacter sp. SPIII_3]
MGTLLKWLFASAIFFLFADPTLGLALFFLWGILALGFLPFWALADLERGGRK